MINQRAKGLNLVHICAQALLAFVLFWALAFFQFGLLRPSGIPHYHHYLTYSLLIGGALMLQVVYASLYDFDILRLDLFQISKLTCRQTLMVAGPFFFYLVAAQDTYISRGFLFSYFSLLPFLFFFSNRYMAPFLAQMCFGGRRLQRTVLCGHPEDLLRLDAWLERKQSFGMQVLGFIPLSEGTVAASLPILGSLDQIEELSSRLRVNQIILTRELPASQLEPLISRCEGAGTRLFFAHGLEEKLGRPIRFFRDDGLYFVSLRHEPLESPFNRVIKRAIDMSVALPIIILVLPWLNLGVWIVHRFQSPGPLFFRQKRIGLHNEEFSIFKYRTMHVGHGREADQATAHDSRVFTLGRWMRKMSIDEMPQFLNVFRGEMSIVGPRPHLFEHEVSFAKMTEFYRIRGLIKPGITGLAQVRGFRGETRTQHHVHQRLQADLYYLENWSPLLDWLIIFRTVWQMIRPPKSAY
ncbi:MAG: Exopolysaccharide biosynthesis polyprenyl glycosylphosphotransferase [Chthoniobacteraceae bacterium]|nr:Exopolysaccharide biosynthesis polyprenyl glycosylphosphotransferase [Chthoniobacteraceae bacterium]